MNTKLIDEATRLLLPASTPVDAVVAASAARRFALSAGLDRRSSTEFAIVVSELATNIVRHAGGRGTVELHADANHVEVRSRDQGPSPGGASQAHRAGLGCGLGAVRRLSDEVVVTKRDDGGLEVIARRRLPAGRAGA